jgi:hypothetical protein
LSYTFRTTTQTAASSKHFTLATSIAREADRGRRRTTRSIRSFRIEIQCDIIVVVIIIIIVVIIFVCGIFFGVLRRCCCCRRCRCCLTFAGRQCIADGGVCENLVDSRLGATTTSNLGSDRLQQNTTSSQHPKKADIIGFTHIMIAIVNLIQCQN